MPIRRLALDVDKVIDRPDMITLAKALETVGTDVTVEGNDIDTAALFAAIESVGAVLHSVDEVVAGDRIIERVTRAR